MLEVSVNFPGMIQTMVNMVLKVTIIALDLRNSTDHIFPFVVAIVLRGDRMLWTLLTPLFRKWLIVPLASESRSKGWRRYGLLIQIAHAI